MKKYFCCLILSLLITASEFSFALEDQTACVQDVVQQFNNLNTNGNNLAVRVNGVMPGRTFTQAPVAMFGLDNHLQGIQRLHNKPYVVLTGADFWHRKGYLFIAKLGTKEGATSDQPFGTNVSRIMPPKSDRMVTKINVGDRDHWHPGGLGSTGDILAVTAEDFKKADRGMLFFYDVTDPEHPKKIESATIDRGNVKAGTIDIFKDKDERFIAFTYTGGLLYFYRSKTTNIADGWEVDNMTTVSHDGGGAVNVVKQCDGQIFLINYENLGKLPPIQNGIDRAYLTKLTFSSGVNDPKIEKIGQIDLNCDGYCNLNGAAGSFVSNDGKLSIYSSKHYRNYWGTRLRLKEFPQK